MPNSESPQPVVINAPSKNSGKSGILILFGIMMLLLIGAAIFYFFPSIFYAIGTIIKYGLLCVISLFIMLSILVLVGFRNEARDILTKVISGSLTTLDIMRELRIGLKTFVRYLYDMTVRLVPLYAIILSITIYFVVIVVYKYIGKEGDVTVFTLLLTFLSTLILGIFGRPGRKVKDPNSPMQRFRRVFTDSIEIMLVVFFLTMDSTNLFFLPPELNTEITAQIGEYNLMERGFTRDAGIGITINIVLVTLAIELFRQGLRIFAHSRKYIQQINQKDNSLEVETKLKYALGRGVAENIDDLLRFVIYFTVIVFVFLFFPRLKLLVMLVVSITSLLLDFLISERLTAKRQEDLLGRILMKIFRLDNS